MTPTSGLAGVDLNSLRPGSMIDVETKSRHYHIECLGGDKIRVFRPSRTLSRTCAGAPAGPDRARNTPEVPAE